MQVSIDKIKVSDRIRKDFGDIEELANDIKENGLINPPVVTPEYELIAGERRLRAMKSLGYNQIEVRIMTVQDALHQLKLEISENENRKDFTFSEKMKWAEQLKVEYEKIARENTLRGTSVRNLTQVGRVDEKISSEVGLGSRDTFRKAEYIYQNASDEDIKAIDEKEKSINAVYQELKEKEKKILELQNELETRPVVEKVKEVEVEKIVEVVPEDYEKLKEKAKYQKGLEEELQRSRKKVAQSVAEKNALKQEMEEMKANTPDEEFRNRLKSDAMLLRMKINEFIRANAGLCWVTDEINQLDDADKRGYIQALDVMDTWVQVQKNNVNEKLRLN